MRFLLHCLCMLLAAFIGELVACGLVHFIEDMKAIAAPVPVPKPVKQAKAEDFVGSWDLEWRGGKGTCQLAKDGYWTCRWAGNDWVGVWRLENGKLKVTEWILFADGTMGNPYSWAGVLKPGTLSGDIVDGGAFLLTRAKKKKSDA